VTSSSLRLALPSPALWPWNDRLGRFSPLKALVLAGLFAPGVWILAQYYAGLLGPRVLNEMIHQTGDWAVRFIVIALAVTPLRHAGQWPKLISVRRMTGLSGLFYALWHLGLYTIDQSLDIGRVVSEIVLRIYLTIGFAAVIGLVVLGLTSFDNVIRRMGAVKWNRLHKIVHVIAGLAILHYFMQSKLDVSMPTFLLGCFLYLEICRVLVWRRVKLGFVALSLNAVISAILTALLEAGWYGIATRIKMLAVLQADFSLRMGLRPTWWVLIAGLAFAFLGGVRLWMKGREKKGRPA
jgi:sulfoxide reductase heme-binding subunit YedZ